MKIYKIKVNGKLYIVELESVTKTNDSITMPSSKEKESDLTTIKAPIQGVIIKTNVEPGTKVSKGTVLFVLEAMKLENDIVSPISGVIKELFVSLGQAVELNQVLLEIR